jgi:hypothetical protein
MSAIIDYIQAHLIKCIILVLCIILVIIYLLRPKVVEGFVENSIESQMNNPFFACPVIKSNITTNESLIEGFTQNNAVESLETTMDMIKAFTNRYEQLECDTKIFKKFPEISPTS